MTTTTAQAWNATKHNQDFPWTHVDPYMSDHQLAMLFEGMTTGELFAVVNCWRATRDLCEGRAMLMDDSTRKITAHFADCSNAVSNKALDELLRREVPMVTVHGVTLPQVVFEQ